MSVELQWILILICTSASLCRYFYVLGKLHGETKANKEAAKHFSPPAGTEG